MNIAILGSGFMGGTHARAYAKLPGVKVVAVSSRSQEKAEKLAAEVGAQATSDDMAILRDPAIDAVSITLPTHLHKAYVLAALQAGKHVLIEKPLALNTADCDEILAAHQTSGKFLMVGHVLRFWPEYRAIYNLLKSGKIGKPLSATCLRFSAPPGWSSWFRNPEQSGGAVLDLVIHDLDALNWLFGTPKTVYARGRQSDPGLWDHLFITVDYGEQSGFVEGSEMLPADYPFSMALSLHCERGRVEYLFRAGGVSVEMGVSSNSLVVYENGNSYKLDAPALYLNSDAYEAQIAYFVDCLQKGEAPQLGNPQEARLAVALANGARRSLETGHVVSI